MKLKNIRQISQFSCLRSFNQTTISVKSSLVKVRASTLRFSLVKSERDSVTSATIPTTVAKTTSPNQTRKILISDLFLQSKRKYCKQVTLFTSSSLADKTYQLCFASFNSFLGKIITSKRKEKSSRELHHQLVWRIGSNNIVQNWTSGEKLLGVNYCVCGELWWIIFSFVKGKLNKSFKSFDNKMRICRERSFFRCCWSIKASNL